MCVYVHIYTQIKWPGKIGNQDVENKTGKDGHGHGQSSNNNM